MGTNRFITLWREQSDILRICFSKIPGSLKFGILTEGTCKDCNGIYGKQYRSLGFAIVLTSIHRQCHGFHAGCFENDSGQLTSISFDQGPTESPGCHLKRQRWNVGRRKWDGITAGQVGISAAAVGYRRLQSTEAYGKASRTNTIETFLGHSKCHLHNFSDLTAQMDASKPIIFYDIASAPPATCFAPNPWKTRYALNFKGVHYRTEWEELPDVTSVRKKLGAEPNESIWTAVHSTHCLSFKTRPPTKSSGIRSRSRSISTKPTRMARLIPDATFGLQAAFNVQVDAIFTQHTLLALHGIPLNPATAEISKAEFARRAGKAWDELTVRGEERTKMLESFKAAPGELAKLYRQKDGVFLDGDRPSYADLIVGGWLKLYKATMEEWEELESWHDGLWKQLYLALEKYAEVK